MSRLPRWRILGSAGRTRWKDAGPDVPILKEAKAEYARLQSP